MTYRDWLFTKERHLYDEVTFGITVAKRYEQTTMSERYLQNAEKAVEFYKKNRHLIHLINADEFVHRCFEQLNIAISWDSIYKVKT